MRIELMKKESMYQDYEVGGCRFRVKGTLLAEAVERMPGFAPFRKDNRGISDFQIVFADGKEHPRESRELYACLADGVDTRFYATADEYRLEMTHEDGAQLELWTRRDSSTLTVQGELKPQMLRFALWVGYGLMTLRRGRIAIHSSCIVKDGKAFLFLGESGTGKSTHTRLWREHIAGSALLNDDSPIIVVEKEEIWVYGSPWSGKTPCYRTERYPLSGCVRLQQAPFNQIKRLKTLQAYSALHPSCPPLFAYDNFLYDGISTTISSLLTKIPVYKLACLPNQEAALLSYATLCCRG